MRLIHALLSWLSVPDRWARWMVLKVVDRLVRLDYLLFEVVQALPMPADLESDARVQGAGELVGADGLDAGERAGGLPSAGDPGAVGGGADVGRGASP